MDLAFLNSLTRNSNMPPVDPWMAGRTINYYYWGYLLAAGATKLANVSTFVSYNLALATFAGYSFVAAACLGFRLSKGRLAAALGAAAGTVFAGNLFGAFDGWDYFLGKGFEYFRASRVIASGDTINEFPFFTFFHADLHPHLLGFPYLIAAFAVGHRFLVREAAPSPRDAPGVWGFLRRWSPALLLALSAETTVASNKWTLPAMAILVVGVCVFRSTRGGAPPSANDALLGVLGGAALVVVGINLWRPYEASYHLPFHGIGRATQTSGLLEFLGVWGILFGVGLAALWPRPSVAEEEERRRRDLVIAVVAATALVAALLMKAPALVLLFLMGLLTARIAWQSISQTHESDDAFAAFLLLLGLAMVAGCEFVYFKDSYGDRLQRMNTIFKFYHQAWPLIAIPIAVFAEKLWREAPGSRRRAVALLLAVSAAAALLYPAAAIVQRLRQRQGPVTLNARLALIRRNPADAAAIAWLEHNVRSGAVLMEATGDPYSEYARISTHTGLPTVMGWANHEGLWRENDPEVAERVGLVRAFYTARDPASAFQILQRYKVTHVVLGELESRSYPDADAIAGRFPFLDPVFPGGTTLFRVGTAPVQ